MDVAKSGSMRAVALTNTDSESWELFPIALYRIHKFAKSYDSDAEVTKLVASMKYCFAIGGDALIMLLLDGRTVTVADLFVGLCITSGASDSITIQMVQAEAINL